MDWWVIYIVIGVVSTVAAAITTPIFRNISWKLNILDIPLGEFHKKHGQSTPLLGGMAMLVAWLITLYSGLLYAVAFGQNLPDQFADVVAGVQTVQSLLLAITAGAILLTGMGFVDDRRPLGPFLKFGLQLIICGLVAVHHKLRITLFLDSNLFTWALTVFWFMFIINAFNFFDNMDGLAAGTAVITGILFTVVAAARSQIFVAALGAATAGVALGFYVYNRYPASIFMGDSGSHFLGFMLAVIGALTMFYNPAASPTAAPILIPVLVLAVLIFDTFAVVIIRLRNGDPIYYGDHNHISHRFQQMGLSRPVAVCLVHLLTLIIGLGALTLLWLDRIGVVLVFIQSAAVLLLVSILHHRQHTEP